MSRNNILILLLITVLPYTGWSQNTAPANAEDSAPVIAKDPDTLPPPQRPPASTPRGRFPPHINNRLQLLAKSTSQQAVKWLRTGSEEFLAIWHPDRSGDGKGAVLMIHAEGELPAWPQITIPIHDTLPDYGWATLAISLPGAYDKPIPPRDFPVKAHLETENEDSDDSGPLTSVPSPVTRPKPYPEVNLASTTHQENLAEERMTAALKFLHDRGQFNVALMGSGIGAIRAHRFMKNITPQVTDKKLKDKLEKPIRALVAYNARNRMPTDIEDYKDWFSDPEIPFLDIYTTTDKRNQQESTARQRMARKKSASYKRVKLSEMSHEVAWGENRLSRRIRSFLEAEVKGIEIDNAIIK